jgi:hypothetical protein
MFQLVRRAALIDKVLIDNVLCCSVPTSSARMFLSNAVVSSRAGQADDDLADKLSTPAAH